MQARPADADMSPFSMAPNYRQRHSNVSYGLALRTTARSK